MSSSLQRRLLLFLGASSLLFSGEKSVGRPLYPVGNDPVQSVSEGTFGQMLGDWSVAVSSSTSEPDHSFQSIWVRIFPLVSVPLGDPYPTTVDYNHVSFVNSGYLSVYVVPTKVLVARGKRVELDFGSGTIQIDGASFPVGNLWISPETSRTTTVSWDEGRVRAELRGGFVVGKSVHIPRDNSGARELWSVTNVLHINDYLRSVVPSEVLSGWNRETLRAQAIAARTYGMYEMAVARALGLDFDVDPSTWYQSYQGAKFWNRTTSQWRTIELSKTSEAVDATRGNVILYNGEVIKAYFSSNSGGFTCLVTECLEQETNPPYIAVVDDHPSIRSSPGGTWGSRATLTPAMIRDVLIKNGIAPPAAVRKIEALEKGPSGRTWRLRVHFADNSFIDLTRPQTRKIMHLFGPIRSFLYQLGAVDSAGKQAIVGHGYGHAVGMSQWGAQLFAAQGWSASRILQHFYHNVTIQDLSQ